MNRRNIIIGLIIIAVASGGYGIYRTISAKNEACQALEQAKKALVTAEAKAAEAEKAAQAARQQPPPAPPAPPVPAGPSPAQIAEQVFAGNVKAWMECKQVEKPAQLCLAPDWEKVVRTLIEEGFTSYDWAVSQTASRRIYNIAGDRAVSVILEYVKDPRVIVAENAKRWYESYCPGAILERIDRKPQTPAPTAPLQRSGYIIIPQPYQVSGGQITPPLAQQRVVAVFPNAERQKEIDKIEDRLSNLRISLAGEEWTARINADPACAVVYQETINKLKRTIRQLEAQKASLQ